MGSSWETCGRELDLAGERDLELWLSLDFIDLRRSGGAFVEIAVKSARTARIRSRSSVFASNNLMKVDFRDYESAQEMHTI